MRKEYQPGVLAMRLHQIERHPVQISPGEAAELLAASQKANGGR